MGCDRPPFFLVRLMSKAKFGFAPLSLRYSAYMIDITLIASLTSIFNIAKKENLVLFEAAFLFFVDPSSAFSSLTTSKGLETISLFSLLAFAYFVSEAITGVGLGKILIRARIAEVRSQKTEMLGVFGKSKYVLMRGLIKAIPPLNILDFKSFIKAKRHRFSDRRPHWVVILTKKRSAWSSIVVASALFLMPLIAGVGYFSCQGSSAYLPQVNRASDSTGDDPFAAILSNNLMLAAKYSAGGLLLLSSTIVQVFSVNFLASLFIGVSLIGSDSGLLLRFIPFFVFEYFGYILGVAGGVEICEFMFTWIDAYRNGEPLTYIVENAKTRAETILILLFVSAVALAIGAYLETLVL